MFSGLIPWWIKHFCLLLVYLRTALSVVVRQSCCSLWLLLVHLIALTVKFGFDYQVHCLSFWIGVRLEKYLMPCFSLLRYCHFADFRLMIFEFGRDYPLPMIWFFVELGCLVLQSSCLYYLHFFQWKLNSFYALLSIVADRIRGFSAKYLLV
jgi:hypothetical protein